jgi:hypothetical protein
MLLELHILTPAHFSWHWTGIVVSCGFKVTFGGGEISPDCMGWVLSGFHYSTKKYDRGGQTSQSILIYLVLSTDFF